MVSLPLRGAWIEIARSQNNAQDHLSLPLRGAWIEITLVPHALRSISMSLPLRGAWIEISGGSYENLGTAGRSPCGERGLKYR